MSKNRLTGLLTVAFLLGGFAISSGPIERAEAASYDCSWADSGISRALGAGNAAAAGQYQTISRYCGYFASDHPVCRSKFNQAKTLYNSDYVAHLPTIYVIIVDYAASCSEDDDNGGPGGGGSENNGGCSKLKSFKSSPVPKVSGSAKSTNVLGARSGRWKPAPDELGYRWYRNGAEIPDATEEYLYLTAADVGQKITVRVTAFKSCYKSKSKLSARTSTVKTQVRPYPADNFSVRWSAPQQFSPRPSVSIYQSWYGRGSASFEDTSWTVSSPSTPGQFDTWAQSYSTVTDEEGDPEFFMPVYARGSAYGCNFPGTVYVSISTQAVPDEKDYRDGFRTANITYANTPLTCPYSYDPSLTNPIKWTWDYLN